MASNTEKALKNSAISVAGQIMVLILQFVNRRIFIIFLDIEYLGYQSLFSNIFSMISVAELGIGNIISFHLYKEIAERNEREIGRLMYLYKWLYRIIAAIVLLLGVSCTFFLPYIVSDMEDGNRCLLAIYFLQLVSVVFGYFLSYKRTIYIANQEEFRCVQIDLLVTAMIQMTQLVTLAVFKNYIVYLIIQLSNTLVSNFIISKRANKDYPYLKLNYTIDKKYIQERNIVCDMGNFLVHKVCAAVYGGVDNIVISAFCGVRTVALYGNYFLIYHGVSQIFFHKLLDPIQATIGNVVYNNRKIDELWKQFNILDAFSFYFATYIGLGFFIFSQPMVELWMGKDYLLPFSFVVTFSITIYWEALWLIVYKYRSIFGDYHQDRNCMIVSALTNVCFSFILAPKFAVTGIQIGTLIAYFPIAYGRIRFVVKSYFGKPIGKYLMKHCLLFSVVVLEGIIICLITQYVPVSLKGLVIRVGVWMIVPLCLNTIIFVKNPYFKEMLKYITKMTCIVIEKIKSDEDNI